MDTPVFEEHFLKWRGAQALKWNKAYIKKFPADDCEDT